MDKQQVWFITGASKGLGLSFVKQLLAAGHQVAATSRSAQELAAAVGTVGASFLPLQVNLADENSVAKALQQTVDKFGRLDVVVNNAGYGIGGSLEELTDTEVRQGFDVNVFGTINVIRKALPYLRAQRSGHIINIASIAGITAVAGWAIYAAAKHAIIGLSEVLAADVKELGIKVTVVAPGAFRTNFLDPGSIVITGNHIPDYTAVHEMHQRFLQMDGAQAGDPEKAVAAMIRITTMPNPPELLLLGTDAYKRAFNKLEQLGNEYKAWEAITTATDY
ncbi:MAG TPA: oxidoreductase [Chitinophaga sp.]|uniref:oxidoreductase n=1 Tax=Chitinophaga sp. TaxID=1869181 RepID=UPI002DBBC702|nr:oxidoreductase [Chitinophaga sp.]HEU4554115.1 oxidoreductase [Chitinophaga sp.]